MRVLIVTAVPKEAEAIGAIEGAEIVVAGIGRTNAAASVTRALLERGSFDLVLSAGVGGALPGSGLSLGDLVVADRCVYAEEGLITPDGFGDMSALGFALGDFAGNAVPVDPGALTKLRRCFRAGTIATVATCSGTDAAAREVVRRTGALVEAMEGAAVVHAARRMQTAGIELRAVSNTTGDRGAQNWDLARGLSTLGEAVRTAIPVLHGP